MNNNLQVPVDGQAANQPYPSDKNLSTSSKPFGNPLEAGKGLTWAQVPMGFYLVSTITVLMYLVHFFTDIGHDLINIPEKTLLGFQLWRLLFGYFVCPDIYSLIFSIFALYMISLTEEMKTGTARYFLDLFYRNVIIQIGVAVIGLALREIVNINIISFGIWPAYIVIITLRCLSHPEDETYLCMMACPVKNKYYPYILLTMFLPFIYLYGLQVDLWLGFIWGHILYYFPEFEKKVDPGNDTIMSTENFMLKFDKTLGTVITEFAAARNAGGSFANRRRNNDVMSAIGDHYFSPSMDGAALHRLPAPLSQEGGDRQRPVNNP